METKTNAFHLDAGHMTPDALRQFYDTRTVQGEQRHWLSQYALDCGYVEKAEIDNQWITLWKEGDCYHVRHHNFGTNERVFWDTFESLTVARGRLQCAVETLERG